MFQHLRRTPLPSEMPAQLLAGHSFHGRLRDRFNVSRRKSMAHSAPAALQRVHPGEKLQICRIGEIQFARFARREPAKLNVSAVPRNGSGPAQPRTRKT